MFSAGADGKIPELRASSLKGAMRFWWRAFNPHIPIDSTVAVNGTKNPGLRELESLIFGGAGFESSEGQRSSFSVQIIGQQTSRETQKLVPHKPSGFEASAFSPSSTFEVIFRIPTAYQVTTEMSNNKVEVFNREKLIALFQLASVLGGMGKRVRRGMGSWQIESATFNQSPISVVSNPTIQDVFNSVKTLSPHYLLKEEVILMNFGGRMDKYPWVRKIEIGKVYGAIAGDRGLLHTISESTHIQKKPEYTDAYNASLGHASSTRFASPIYVSVLPDRRPIITTLNTVPPDRDTRHIDPRLQENFKRSIL